jgi:D-methionine transport system ATP-binding protein
MLNFSVQKRAGGDGFMIEFQNVSKIFKTKECEVKALENVSLTIEDGDIYGIIGFSGAGKSTLIRTINALEVPTSGKVLVDGEDINALKQSKLRQKRKKIGMIFQQFNLLETKTVYENIALPLVLNHVPKDQIKKKVQEVLEYVELTDKKDVYPSKLSGGQKQRVGIARALATDPSILLSDESTSALDPKTTKAILKLLKRINKELGITIVLITHEMNVIQSICHHVAVMESGRVVEKGNVLDVFSEPQQEITKNFVKTVINDSVPELLIESIRSEKKNNKLLKLKFLDSDSTESVLSGVNKKFDVETNILFANISEIQERVLGIIIVQIIGAKNEIEGAQKYFSEHGVGYKEIYI